MQRNLFLWLLGVLIAVWGLPLSAQKQKHENTPLRNETIYIFGVSQHLADSVVYISGISELSGQLLDKKGLLLHRNQYAEQFRTFLEKEHQLTHQTVAVFFAKNAEKALKKWQQVQRKNDKKKQGSMTLRIRNVFRDDFSFRYIPSDE